MVSQLKQQTILIYIVEVHQAAFSEVCFTCLLLTWTCIALKLVSLEKSTLYISTENQVKADKLKRTTTSKENIVLKSINMHLS